jgi:hypothetical protein
MTFDLVKSVYLSALLVPLLTGCGVPPEQPAAPPPASPGAAANGISGAAANGISGAAANGISGRLLHTIAPGPDHVIEFYDFGHGETAVHESLLIGGKPLLDEITKETPISEIFRRLQPGAAVPQAIVDAEASAGEYRATAPVAAPAAGTALRRASVPIQPLANNACSFDFQSDNWSGRWFLDNYCNEGSFRQCQQNVPSASVTLKGSWFRWKQMEGDWNVNGHTSGWHDYFDCGIFACGSKLKVDWDYDVLPRHVEIWTYGASGSNSRGADGSSACGHLHEAALWNN